MKNDTLLNKFFNIREDLFATKLDHIRDIKSKTERGFYNLKQWNNEYASVNMCFGRRAGATYWMYCKTKELWKKDKRVMICSYNLDTSTMIVDSLKRDCVWKECICVSPTKINNSKSICVFSQYQFLRCIEHNFLVQFKPDFIFIDPSVVIENKVKKYIFENFTPEMIVSL